MTPAEERWWTYPLLWLLYTVYGIGRNIKRRWFT